MTEVSQMEHGVYVWEIVLVRVRACAGARVVGRGELMSLLWAIIWALARHSAIIKANIAELPNRQHNKHLR